MDNKGDFTIIIDAALPSVLPPQSARNESYTILAGCFREDRKLN
jgi:hypothetical protein